MEETLGPGASVSRVARRHDVNANQVFYWRKLYSEGRLGGGAAASLLPVKVSEEEPAEAAKWDSPTLRSGTMKIKVSKGTMRIAGSVNVVALRPRDIGTTELKGRVSGTQHRMTEVWVNQNGSVFIEESDGGND